jgi:hypothetical protein
MTELPVPEPRQDPADAAYWAAAAQGVLTVPYCSSCQQYSWFPRRHCPVCGGTAVELRPVSGDGVVYSFTINRRPAGAFRDQKAVIIAYVELTEGPRVLTNLVGVDPADVRIGLPVRAVFDSSPHGAGVLRFTRREVARDS